MQISLRSSHEFHLHLVVIAADHLKQSIYEESTKTAYKKASISQQWTHFCRQLLPEYECKGLIMECKSYESLMDVLHFLRAPLILLAAIFFMYCLHHSNILLSILTSIYVCLCCQIIICIILFLCMHHCSFGMRNYTSLLLCTYLLCNYSILNLRSKLRIASIWCRVSSRSYCRKYEHSQKLIIMYKWKINYYRKKHRRINFLPRW